MFTYGCHCRSNGILSRRVSALRRAGTRHWLGCPSLFQAFEALAEAGLHLLDLLLKLPVLGLELLKLRREACDRALKLAKPALEIGRPAAGLRCGRRR